MHHPLLPPFAACSAPCASHLVDGSGTGWLGDRAHRMNANHGRIAVAQTSVFAGMLVTYVLLNWIPHTTDHWFTFAITMAAMSMVATWTPAGCLRPVVTDISDEETRGFVLGYWLALEGCASAIGAPMVAFLSQDVFGYTPSHQPISEMALAARQTNAAALSQALTLTMLLPWAVCFMFFTAMHWVYPADYARAKDMALAKKDDLRTQHTSTLL